MRLPIIPTLVAVTLLTALVYLFNSVEPRRKTLDIPRLTRLADVDGTETEVAIASEGDRYAVIASGELWFLNLATGERKRLTQTPEPESFPSWTPDGRRVTFTRGAETFAMDPEGASEEILKSNATSLAWSAAGRMAFVRDRSLWIADSGGENERQIIEADQNPDVTIRTPRFSPDSTQVAFIKSMLGLRGEVWLVDVLKGEPQPLVVDRQAENPTDLGWIMDGRQLVYLTNRAGAYSLWHIDLAASTILPLTQPLVGVPLEQIGFAVWKDRVVVPRHFVDSNIALSDGTPLVQTENPEFEPSASRDGRLVAYTVEKDNKFEVWTTTVKGENPTFRTIGRDPRFSASGFQLVYTHTDLAGNADIWRIDIRNGVSERLTDAGEIDIMADWSPDGQSIVFSSARGGALSIWTIPASGGKRLRLNDGGLAPRYSSDGRSIFFWREMALWKMDADGGNPQPVEGGFPRTSWPKFDTLPDGRTVTSQTEIRETGLWAVDLTYKES